MGVRAESCMAAWKLACGSPPPSPACPLHSPVIRGLRQQSRATLARLFGRLSLARCFPKEEADRLEASGHHHHWAREAVEPAAHPHPPNQRVAPWAVGKPSNATHSSAHWSSCPQRLPAWAGCLPCCLSDPAACWPPASPPTPRGSVGTAQERKSHKRASSSAPLTLPGCGQLVSKKANPRSSGNRGASSWVGMPRHAPPSGPSRTRQAEPNPKAGLERQIIH